MTSPLDDTDPMEESGSAQPSRLSRRKVSIGLAATAAVTAVGLGRLVSGQVKYGPGTAATNSAGNMDAMGTMGASPAASPAASPMASPGATPAAGAQVSIQSFSFVPASLEVPVGTTVIWTNNDDIPHTVTSDDHKAMTSGALDTGDKYTHRFVTAGTYPYFCSFHPFMTAKVIVK